MTDGAQLDKNDAALTDYLLRGMRRFKNHVHTQNADEPWGRIFGRVEIAYQRARAQFQRELQQQAAGETE